MSDEAREISFVLLADEAADLEQVGAIFGRELDELVGMIVHKWLYGEAGKELGAALAAIPRRRAAQEDPE